MTVLITGSVLFIFSHFALSNSILRSPLVEKMGEDVFLGIYSLIAFITFGLLIYGYTIAPVTDSLWVAGKSIYSVSKVLMLFSIMFLVMGLMNRSPLAMKMEVGSGQNLTGILKITRHPVQWAILLWGLSHSLANGDTTSLIFFGTFVIVAGIGTVLMDNKFRNKSDPAWAEIFARTSNLPFLAILTGKTRFTFKDINWQSEAIGLTLYVCLYVSHEWLSGVSIY